MPPPSALPMRRPLLALLPLLARCHASAVAATAPAAACSAQPRAAPGVSMLQRPSRSEHAATTAQEIREIPESLQKVLPIYWVHVPKCGSSFINTLAHLPGVCPHVPSDLYISESTFGRYWLSNFSHKWHMKKKCTGLLNTDFGHSGIGNETSSKYLDGKGHFMIMLREPKERLMSAHAHMGFTWENPGKFNVMTPGSAWGGWPEWKYPKLVPFVKYARGCAVRMLTRQGMSCGGAGGPPSSDEVKLAKHRLRKDFSFVGLTGQWALSMCLFDAMFKTGCSSLQFEDTRPGVEKSSHKKHEYDLSLLKGTRDEYDEDLYATAVEIFNGNLKRYNVTRESCECCWRSAGVPQEAQEQPSAFFQE